MVPEAAELASRERSLARAAGQVSTFVVGPIFLAWMIWMAVAGQQYLVDFEHSFLPASRAVVHGLSPYPGDAHLRAVVNAHTPIEAYLYPPLLAVVEAPLLLLPHAVAVVVYSLMLAAALGGALWLMGIRDLRCYTVVCLWPATFTGFQTGAVSFFLAFGIALAWRWRGHATRLGILVAVLVALKLFVWPLGLWLLVTRRYRATLWSVSAFPVVVLGGWALIGFHGLRSYPHLLSVVSIAEAPLGFGIGGISAGAHIPQEATLAASMLVVAVACARLLAAPPRDLDRVALTLAVCSMLLLSPVVWLHYLIVLVIPTALASRRFSWIWVAPALFQFAAVATMSGVYPNGNPVTLALSWASIIFTTTIACQAPGPGGATVCNAPQPAGAQQ